MDIQFQLNNYLTGDDFFYIHREEITPKSRKSLHFHDYAEIFCVEKGSGWHDINGSRFRLNTGALCLIRPEDEHNLLPKSDFQIINIAFPSASLRLLDRYQILPSPAADSRVTGNLSPPALEHFSTLCRELSLSDHSRLALESFLLDTLKLLKSKSGKSRETESLNGEQKSLWTTEFTHLLMSPEFMIKNVSEMAEFFGFSREHFSREVKKCFDKTAKDLINTARVKHACFQLKMTKTPVPEIAETCGYYSLGQFYSVFKKFTGMTPREYRLFRP